MDGIDHKMTKKTWEEIGTVIGSTSVDSYGFLLSSLKASVGDIVITETEIPSVKRGKQNVFIWGRIVGMDRTNPTFPNEAAAVPLPAYICLRQICRQTAHRSRGRVCVCVPCADAIRLAALRTCARTASSE